MDYLIENVTKSAVDRNSKPVAAAPKEADKPSGIQTSKACRYGEHCTRANCRFRHPGQETGKVDFEKSRAKRT